MTENITFTVVSDAFICPVCAGMVTTPHSGNFHSCPNCQVMFWRSAQIDTSKPPACDNCLFARGYSCCAHPTTIPFPSRRWCGEHQPRRV